MAVKAIPTRKDILPRELQRSAPRPVSLNGSGVAAAAALVSLLLFGAGGGLWIYQEATGDTEESQRLAAEGRSTKAAVVRIEHKSGDGNRTFLHYRYAADGKEFDGVTRLRKRDRSRYSIGSTVGVRYLPSRPQASWMQGYEPNGVPLWLAPVVFVSPTICAVPIGWLLRRQRRLLADGRSALARVLSAEKMKGQEQKTWRVHYEWKLLSGATRRGKHETTKTPPPPGTLIPILYDREEPRRHARYPLPLVKIARL